MKHRRKSFLKELLSGLSCHHLLTLPTSYYFFFLEKNKRRYLDIMSKLLCSIQRKWIVIYIYKWQTLYSKSSHEKGWETDEIEVIHWKSYPQFENLIFSHVKYIWKSVVSVLTCIKAVFFYIFLVESKLKWHLWEYFWSITGYILVPRTKLFYC